jgi:hypothetical protein
LTRRKPAACSKIAGCHLRQLGEGAPRAKRLTARCSTIAVASAGDSPGTREERARRRVQVDPTLATASSTTASTARCSGARDVVMVLPPAERLGLEA